MKKPILFLYCAAALCACWKVQGCLGSCFVVTLRRSDGFFSRTAYYLKMASDVAAADQGTAPTPSPEDRMTARRLVFEGMEAFRSGNVQQSIELFDRAEATQGASLTPFLWQRGISYYYDDDYAKASKQFRTDVRVNPSDVEEIVWDIASQLRLPDATFPIPNQLSLPPGTRDRRRIMPTVYKLFRGEGTEHDLALAGHSAGASAADEFYSLFYLGLYCEARGESSKAAEYMQQACRTNYATGVGRGDYMTSCAKVHCKLRGWA